MAHQASDFEIGDFINWFDKFGHPHSGIVVDVRHYSVEVKVDIDGEEFTFWTNPPRLEFATNRTNATAKG